MSLAALNVDFLTKSKQRLMISGSVSFGMVQPADMKWTMPDDEDNQDKGTAPEFPIFFGADADAWQAVGSYMENLLKSGATHVYEQLKTTFFPQCETMFTWFATRLSSTEEPPEMDSAPLADDAKIEDLELPRVPPALAQRCERIWNTDCSCSLSVVQALAVPAFVKYRDAWAKFNSSSGETGTADRLRYASLRLPHAMHSLQMLDRFQTDVSYKHYMRCDDSLMTKQQVHDQTPVWFYIYTTCIMLSLTSRFHNNGIINSNIDNHTRAMRHGGLSHSDSHSDSHIHGP